MAVLSPDLAAVVMFAILTGARLATILRLKWVDIGPDTITLRGVKSVRDNEDHVLPLISAVRKLLDTRRGQHAEFVFTYVCQDAPPVRNGEKRIRGERYPFSDTGWRRTWKKALKAAGITNFRFHDLRHTAGTRITRAKGIRVAGEVLGHRDPKSTARYAHVDTDDMAAGMEAASRKTPEK